MNVYINKKQKNLVLWFICSLNFGIAVDIDVPKPFMSTSLMCYTYQKKSGRMMKRLIDDCMLGNACCYSFEFTGKSYRFDCQLRVQND